MIMRNDFWVNKGGKLVKGVTNISNVTPCALAFLVAFALMELISLAIHYFFQNVEVNIDNYRVAYYAPILTIIGTYWGVVLQRLLGEYLSTDKEIKPSKTNIALMLVLSGVIIFAIAEIIPSIENTSKCYHDAFSLLLGGSFFAASFLIYWNPTDRIKSSDEVKMRVNSLTFKKKYCYVERSKYKAIQNTVSSFYLVAVFALILSHLSGGL